MTQTLQTKTILDAQSGDPAALNELIKSGEKIIRKVVSPATGADADDLVQNTLIRLADSIGQLTDPNVFPAWLSTIARNEMRMFYRGKSRREHAQMHFGFEPKLSRDDTLTPDIRSAIAELPSSHQLILNQLYVAGLSYQEIANSLDLPITAVKSRLHRARNRLKKEMDMQSTAHTISLSKTDVESLHHAARFRHLGEGRENLSGVYLDKAGFAIGTDGHHLIIRSLEALNELSTSLLIDPTTMDAVTDTAALSVHIDEVRLKTATELVAFNISDQSFPDYHAILPQDQPIECPLSRTKFIATLNRFKEQLSRQPDVSKTVLLTIDLEEQFIAIDANNITSPGCDFSLHDELPVTRLGNRLGVLKIAVNIDLLLDCLLAIDGDEFSLKGSAWNKPLDIVGTTHRAVLMPIQL